MESIEREGTTVSKKNQTHSDELKPYLLYTLLKLSELGVFNRSLRVSTIELGKRLGVSYLSFIDSSGMRILLRKHYLRVLKIGHAGRVQH